MIKQKLTVTITKMISITRITLIRATTHQTLLYVILASLLGVVGAVWCTVYGLNKFRISACTKLPMHPTGYTSKCMYRPTCLVDQIIVVGMKKINVKSYQFKTRCKDDVMVSLQ